MDDPAKLAVLLLKRHDGGDKKTDNEGEGDEGESSDGASAFTDAVKLAMKGDSAAAFDALKVAVRSCADEA